MKKNLASWWMAILFLPFGHYLLHPSAHAVLPEPDNILYGAIALDGRPITAADFDVVIEVRRAPAGRAISSYQMGSQLRLGHFYSVRVPLESLAPKTDTNATFTGDMVYLVIRDSNGERETHPVTVGARGSVLRLDIGNAVPDSDGDGLPDAWELARFGHLGNGPGTINGNGQTTVANYVSGVNPNDPTGTFRLTITESAPNKFVSFFAYRSSGPGYEGYDRYYALEYATNPPTGPWLGVLNYTNILGNNATISYQTAEPNPKAFYRGRVSLRTP